MTSEARILALRSLSDDNLHLIEREADLNVVVFTSRNPDFFLAHYDTEGDPMKTLSMPNGPTGMHPWLDLTARLSRAPVVSIASIRGRARGAGSGGRPGTSNGRGTATTWTT